MALDTLYLHIGWSKTGTSAVQSQLDANYSELKKRGILYSKTMQMNDNAHHHFALAFRSTTGYPAKYNIADALTILEKEIVEAECHSAIISSELSPFYFDNPRFKKWVEQFSNVKVIATVRPQSEIILSLFNQLIKDPQVRYGASIFSLTLNNIANLNYFQHINKWSKKVGKENVSIINYQDGVVNSFLNLFALSTKEVDGMEIVNPSLPTEILLALQDKAKGVDNPVDYKKIRDDLVDQYKVNKNVDANRLLISSSEQAAIDNYYKGANNRLSKEYLDKDQLFINRKKADIFVL